MPKNLDETVREKRRVDAKDKRRDYMGLKRAAGAHPLGQLMSWSFSGRNKCAGTHGSKGVEKKTVSARCAKELEVKRKTEERTARESERREMTDLLVVPRPVESLQNDVGFSGKT